MKKNLLIGLCIAMVITMVGCGKNNETQEGSAQGKDIIGNEQEGTVSYLGKVKNIIGNEIEIELAKDDESILTLEDIQNMQDGTAAGTGMDVVMAVESTGSIEATEGEIELSEANGEITMVESGDNSQSENSTPIELEYTGETKSIIIPAGASVFDLRSFSESKLDAIKKGAIVRITATGKEESPVVSGIEIVN